MDHILRFPRTLVPASERTTVSTSVQPGSEPAAHWEVRLILPPDVALSFEIEALDVVAPNDRESLLRGPWRPASAGPDATWTVKRASPLLARAQSLELRVTNVGPVAADFHAMATIKPVREPPPVRRPHSHVEVQALDPGGLVRVYVDHAGDGLAMEAETAIALARDLIEAAYDARPYDPQYRRTEVMLLRLLIDLANFGTHSRTTLSVPTSPLPWEAEPGADGIWRVVSAGETARGIVAWCRHEGDAQLVATAASVLHLG